MPKKEDIRNEPQIPLFIMKFLTLFSFATLSFLSADSGRSLFDGKSLKGWDGNPDHWRVENGAILGENTKENPTKGNTFLIWKELVQVGVPAAALTVEVAVALAVLVAISPSEGSSSQDCACALADRVKRSACVVQPLHIQTLPWSNTGANETGRSIYRPCPRCR